jgi:hypothetical protein
VRGLLAVDDFSAEELVRTSKKKVTRKKKTTTKR